MKKTVILIFSLLFVSGCAFRGNHIGTTSQTTDSLTYDEITSVLKVQHNDIIDDSFNGMESDTASNSIKVENNFAGSSIVSSGNTSSVITSNISLNESTAITSSNHKNNSKKNSHEANDEKNVSLKVNNNIAQNAIKENSVCSNVNSNASYENEPSTIYSSRTAFPQSDNQIDIKNDKYTKLYYNIPTNTKRDKMNLLNARFQLYLPYPVDIINFVNEKSFLYTILEYKKEDYINNVHPLILKYGFDRLTEKDKNNRDAKWSFNPIHKPLKKQKWWNITLDSNVVFSYTRSFDLLYGTGVEQIDTNEFGSSTIQTPHGIETAIYVVESKNRYFLYCALESLSVYEMERSDTLSKYLFGD